eukprot:jgi/Picsp_1/3568/NSC_06405-R1_gamma-secretase subunit aph-1b
MLGAWGLVLLAVGPLVVLYLLVVAKSSFTIILSLASAFCWTIVFLAISTVFVWFEPLDETIWAYLPLVVAGSVVQEVARWYAWKFHRICVRVLQRVARERRTSVRTSDVMRLSLTHGVGHAMVHATLFSISWLPLRTGTGTYYITRCSSMSYFLANSLLSLALSGILISCTVIAFDCWDRRQFRAGFLYSGTVHVGVALMILLLNFKLNGCMISIPISLAVSLATCGYAIKKWWIRTANEKRTDDESDSLIHHSPVAVAREES